jgi:hypothetical protein
MQRGVNTVKQYRISACVRCVNRLVCVMVGCDVVCIVGALRAVSSAEYGLDAS